MIATRVQLAPSQLSVPNASSLVRVLTPYVWLAALGIEIALLAAFVPDTLDRFLHGPTADFHNLYRVAGEREVPGLYSPFLVLLFQPLVFMPEMAAFRLFFAVNVVCLIAVAFMTASAVHSWEARTALFLAPLALPQVHWALRLGHLTPLLLLVALSALLLLRTRPKTAAMMLALLSLKPQYLIAPAIYLAWRRRFQLLATTVGTAALLALAGFAVLGPGAFADFVALYLDWGPNSTDNLLPVQQSWMISWTGVQISMGAEPNPLITIDFILLSLAIAMFAWARTSDAAGIAAIGLMFIPLTPYAQFYDGAFVLVAIALILRAGLPAAAAGALCAGLYFAAVVTQSNVNFPVKDVLGAAQTDGFYWLTPALVLATGIIAAIAQRRPPEQEAV